MSGPDWYLQGSRAYSLQTRIQPGDPFLLDGDYEGNVHWRRSWCPGALLLCGSVWVYSRYLQITILSDAIAQLFNTQVAQVSCVTLLLTSSRLECKVEITIRVLNVSSTWLGLKGSGDFTKDVCLGSTESALRWHLPSPSMTLSRNYLRRFGLS